MCCGTVLLLILPKHFQRSLHASQDIFPHISFVKILFLSMVRRFSKRVFDTFFFEWQLWSYRLKHVATWVEKTDEVYFDLKQFKWWPKPLWEHLFKNSKLFFRQKFMDAHSTILLVMLIKTKHLFVVVLLLIKKTKDN